MRDPEEIKRALEICALREDNECKDCPYQGEAHCVDMLMLDAQRYIEQLEAALASAPAQEQSWRPNGWIEVLDNYGKVMFVDATRIISVEECFSANLIRFTGSWILSSESIKEILAKIREAME